MKFSILGTGAMGTGMGEAILNAGHELIVYNRTPNKTKKLVEKGAKAVLSPAQAIKDADISIFVMLDGNSVIATLSENDVLKEIKDKKLINASTSNVENTMRMKEIIVGNGGSFVEMSLQAIPDTLRDATGSFHIGCPIEEEAFWIKTLSSFSSEVIRIGDIGDVSKIDLVNLLGFTFSLVKTAYMVALAQRYNISSSAYEPIISMSDPAAQYFMGNMIAHNYDTISGNVEGNIELMKMSIKEIKSKNISTDLLESILKTFEHTSKMGFAQKDGAAILEFLLSGEKS